MSGLETLQQIAQRHIEEILLEYVDEFRESLGLDWYCLTLGKHGDGRPHKALSNQLEPLVDVEMAPSDPPAVSESAAGDVIGRVVKGGPIKPGYRDDDWPGPDWSQAPEWAKWWTSDAKSGLWWSKEPAHGETLWRLASANTQYQQCSSFNYPGHWRDSLRRRP